MYNHAPKNYDCPFCLIGKNSKQAFGKYDPAHLIYAGKRISAFISSKQWPKNQGIVIIIPNRHFENIYNIPDKLLAEIQILGKKIAIAMKKGYKCDGVSTRQHNEPAGNQSIWHYHLQVVPRYTKDEFYLNHWKGTDIPGGQRTKYAKLIKKYLHGK